MQVSGGFNPLSALFRVDDEGPVGVIARQGQLTFQPCNATTVEAVPVQKSPHALISRARLS